MAQSKHEIQAILAQAGIDRPRHRFGQNFMIDQNLVHRVADAGQISRDDLVIEVGPGTGTLTEELLGRAWRVVAVEIDRDLARLLRQRFGAEEDFQLIEGDALAGKHQLNEALAAVIREAMGQARVVKLVANLPYNIASPLIVELLVSGVELLAFTVQREVADRLRASAGEDAYGPLSVMAQLLGRVEVLRTLPPQAFWPAPNVESALARIRRDDRLGERCGSFSRFVHQLFAERRKTLRNALTRTGCDAAAVLRRAELDGQARPERLDPAALLRLFQSSDPRASDA